MNIATEQIEEAITESGGSVHDALNVALARLDVANRLLECQARDARLATLVTPELASLLCDLAAGCDHSAWLAAERGWVVAANIREMLG